MIGTRQALPIVAAFVLGCGSSDDGRASKSAQWHVNPARVLAMDVARQGSTVFAVGERGLILASESGGQSWVVRPTSTTRTLTAVAFGEGSVGVAVGHAASLLRTTDGGQTWTPVVVAEAASDSLLGVTHLGGQRFVAYGVFGLYLESGDGGATWTRRPIELPAEKATAEAAAEEDALEGAAFDRHITMVFRFGEELILVGESGTLARSADAGQTWRRIASPYAGSYFGALVSPKNSLVVYGMRGTVFRSTDGGTNWTRIPLASVSGLNGGTVLADGSLVLVGNNGLVAVSNDDGATFTTRTANGGRDIAQVLQTEGGALIGVGAAGVRTIDLAALKN